MALEEKFKESKKAKADNKLTRGEEGDADLAVAMAAAVMSNPQMIEALVGQVASADPVMALGTFVAETMLDLKEQCDANGIDISDRVWTAQGGVADRLVDQAILNLVAGGGPDLEGADAEIFDEVVNVLKLGGQVSGGGQQPPQGQPPGAPPAGGPPMGPPMGPPPQGVM